VVEFSKNDTSAVTGVALDPDERELFPQSPLTSYGVSMPVERWTGTRGTTGVDASGREK